MCDRHQAFRPPEDAFQALPRILRVERGKALVQDEDIGSLQESTRYEDAASLTLRKLPSRLAHGLLHARGRA